MTQGALIDLLGLSLGTSEPQADTQIDPTIFSIVVDALAAAEAAREITLEGCDPLLPHLMTERVAGLSNNGINNSTTIGVEAELYLEGSDQNDVLTGSSVDELVVGYAGDDILTGAGGDDSFYFTSYSDGVDVITDFGFGADQIRIDRNGFGAFDIDAGILGAESFVIGSSATTADQHFIYDQSTGALYFDADGVGGSAQVQFATLSNHANLSHGDIMIGI
ncbi:hypothetical protein Lepto7376_1432 [[Leptolyngbya] sp. PCC 7376]|uniref:calcium-binding protein n=1 Tax=[Leptolyngbya] sp. PCC 7376 TaxID=111781 RepID=UPI00029F06FF|nr:calcium-binding protein [[Leptolyngbya] sp. PCC 7376]AFY37776.1 hypothetical protein Lepto7376_1432 [[Leptolyngbya] sp. PCC 7376]